MNNKSRMPSAPAVGRTVTTRPAAASVGASIHMKGEISGNEDLLVLGKVEGTLSLPKNNLVVGPDGIVHANVNAMSITVEGSVVGELAASERIVISRSGCVEGNIKAPRIVLEDGAKFKGSIDMEMDHSAKINRPVAPAPGDKHKISEVKRVGNTTTG